MRKTIPILGIAVLCLVHAHAQLTTITASHLNMGGVPIAAGKVLFTPVNAAGQAIPFVQGDGGLNSPTAYSCNVTAGAITGTCQVPDSALTTPANILYSINLTDPASFLTYTMPTVPGITGATWALDAYAPPATTTNVQPIQMSYGTAAAPNPCVVPSMYVRNSGGGQLYICVAGAPVLVTGSTVTASAMASALGAQTGCATAGNAWNPATNTCTPSSGGASACPLQNATNLCITQSPYNASGAGLTTTAAASVSSGSTMATVASCVTFLPGNGFLIPGAGASGANFIDTVTSCTGTTLTHPNATSTTVSSVTIQHDETAAFLAAIAALNPSSGTIWVPDGTYLVNGPLLDTSGANAILPMPKLPTGTTPYVLISIKGLTRPTWGTLSGTIIETSASTGNLIGGYDSAGSLPPLTNSGLVLDNLTFVVPTNPGIKVINGRNLLKVSATHLIVDSVAGTLPSNTNGVGISMPILENNVENFMDDVVVLGLGTDFIIGEHTHVGAIYASNSINCFVFDNGATPGGSGGYWGNSSSVAYMWGNGCTNYIGAGTYGGTLNVAVADTEANTTDINDSGNLLFGIVNYNTAFSTHPTAVVVGGINLQINSLRQIPQFQPPSPGTAAAFYRICGDVSSSSGCVPTSSTTVYDSSGNGNNGTWNGTPSGTTDWYSASTPEAHAGTFDGTNNYIQTGYTPTSITNFTLVAWLSASATAIQVAVSDRITGAANGIFLYTESAGGSAIQFAAGITNAGANTIEQGGEVTTGSWHCVAVTHVAGATSLTLYVDGIAVGTSSASAAANPGNAGPLYIGQDGTYGTPSSWNGLINDVRFYTSVIPRSSIPGCI